MYTMVNKICNVKKHPIMTAIVIVQIVFLLLLFTKACITPRQIINVDMESFAVDGENAYLKDGSVYFCNQGSIGDDNRLNVSTEEMGIPSGAYRVEIAYNSEVNDNKINENNANVSVSSRWRISFDAVTLDDQNNLVSGKLWIPFYSDCNDLKINISYNGKGTLNVDHITLTEALWYRIIRLVGFCILFLLMDLGALIFYTNVEMPIKRSHAILLLITIVASLPFFSKTLFGGHDLYCHLLRIVSVAEGLGNGQLPVRMNTELNNGYGYPWSIYYCDIFLYPSAVLYRMSVPLRICYQIYVMMVNAATTVFTYLAVGKFTKRTSLKLLGTGLYVLCIYRLVNVNVRAATGEYTAMTFLPLIVAGLYLIYTKEKIEFKDWLYLTCGMSGVIMSHVLTGEMIALNIVLLCIVLLKRTLAKEVFSSLVKAAALTVGITAWFLIPFLDYYMHHITLVQKGDLRLLENSTVEVIYLFQLFSPGKEVGHYITIGLPLIMVIGLVLICLKKYKKNETQRNNLLRLISGFAFLNILFVSKYFPWGRIQNHLGIEGAGYQVGTIQFAWRFLSIASILLVFAMIIAMNMLADHDIKSMRMVTLALVGCIVFSAGFFYYRYADEVGTSSNNILQSYSNSDNLYLLDETDRSVQDRSRPEVVSGNVIINSYYRDRGVYKLYVENQDKADAEVSVPIYNYRYFNVYDENGTLLDKNTTDKKCISVKVPASYEGKIAVKYESPYLWRAAELISIICIMFVVWKLLIPISMKKLKK